MNNTKSPKQTYHSKDDPNPKSTGTKRAKRKIPIMRARQFVDKIFAPTEHAKRVESLVSGVTGITQAAVLSIHAIGRAYAQLAGITALGAASEAAGLNDRSRFWITESG